MPRRGKTSWLRGSKFCNFSTPVKTFAIAKFKNYVLCNFSGDTAGRILLYFFPHAGTYTWVGEQKLFAAWKKNSQGRPSLPREKEGKVRHIFLVPLSPTSLFPSSSPSIPPPLLGKLLAVAFPSPSCPPLATCKMGSSPPYQEKAKCYCYSTGLCLVVSTYTF